jgi:phage-related protein
VFDYFDSLSDKEQAKFVPWFERMAQNAQIPPNKFHKLRNEDLYEFIGGDHRFLCFWGNKKSNLILTHGFRKRTQKTPIKEIDLANAIRTESSY